jgi:hypothetical protein
MDFSKYKNKKPFPEFNSSLPKEETQKVRLEYFIEENRLSDLFKEDLFKEHGVSEHPKRERCYSLAYEYGHSSGYSEVANYFNELVNLIK